MGRTFDGIEPELAAWIEAQRIFFVATAPLAADGLVNCSPKGMDSFRILGPREVAYLDLTGSGVETIAHLRENGRIAVMFCAFAGPPRIVRLQGTGVAIPIGDPQFDEAASLFPATPGARAVIRIRLSRIADSCGYSIPRYDYVDERDALVRWAESKGEQGVADYRAAHNVRSLDGLPGIDAPH